MNNKSSFPWKSLNLALSLAGIVVIPLVLAALAGRWLDNRFGTWPWIFLGMTLFVFVISNIFIVFRSMKAMQEIEQEGKEK
jgi:F0F1-type ATP synthase assembly protein I